MSRAVLASSATLSLDSRVVTFANNRFHLGERVGEGGMVFAAWDRCLARTVAIKLSRVGATRSLCATLLAAAHADRPEGAADEFAGVRRVLERGCEEPPARRYPNMRAFVAALSRCGGR